MTKALAWDGKSTTGRAVVDRPFKVPPAIVGAMRATSALSTVAAAELARLLFFKTFRTRASQEQRAVLNDGAPFSVRVRGGIVRGWSYGGRPMILLLHGWNGNAGQMTSFIKPLLARGYGVAIVDGPGHGSSSGQWSSIVHFAAAIRALSEHFGGLHAVVAHSLGGAAVPVALRDGLSLKRTALVAPPAHFDVIWERFRVGVGVSVPVFERMLVRAQRWLGVSFDPMRPEAIAPSMTTPLLVVHDVGDREVAHAEGAALAASWPGARMHTTTGLGHVRLLHDAGVVERVADFVTA